jgi:hypothetical protein
MTDLDFYVTMAGTGLAGLGMVVAGGLHGWRGWLQLKHEALATKLAHDRDSFPGAHAGARIEIADLKERIRKLEAIAAGVDL